MLRAAPRFLGAFGAPLAWAHPAQANDPPEVEVLGERAASGRGRAAAADAVLAAEREERAVAARAVAAAAQNDQLVTVMG
jgi:hypothetical protein